MIDFHPAFDTINRPFGHRTRNNLLGRDWSQTVWHKIIFDATIPSSSPHHVPSPYPSPAKSPGSTESSPSYVKFAHSSWAHECILGDYRSSGRLSDTFTGFVGPDLAQRVVIKLTDLESFTLLGDEETYELSSARAALMNEIHLYTTHLASLQGIHVPELLSVYVGRTPGMREAVMMVLEDVGEAVADTWESMPYDAWYVYTSLLSFSLPQLKCFTAPRTSPFMTLFFFNGDDRIPILDAYQALHSKGVMHQDIEARHIRRGPDGQGKRVRLIDFEGSKWVGPNAEAEAAYIRRLMDLLRE